MHMRTFLFSYSVSSRSGFTLIEFLIALGLFAIVVSVAVGGFVRALVVQRQLVGLASANSNVSLAVEQMAREIRTGTDFSCNAEPCDELRFLNARGNEVIYKWIDDGDISSIQRREVCTQSVGCSGTGDFENITGTNVDISDLRFLLFTTPVPRVTISLGLAARESSIRSTVVRIQTTVSARNQ